MYILIHLDSQTESKSPSYRNTMTTFGATQRLKSEKQTKLGPGSQYNQIKLVLNSLNLEIISDVDLTNNFDMILIKLKSQIDLNINITNMYDDEQE